MAANRPIDLEQQRKRAKELLAAHRAGVEQAVVRVQRNLPRAGGLALDQVRGLTLKLSDAQLVVAREAGFPTWPRMKRATSAAALDVPATPLELAIRSGAAAAVRAALATRPPRWEAREALELAVERGDAEISRLLIEYGAWPDHAGRRWGRGGGCVHAALLLCRGVELLEVLLGAGASVSARDRDGRTPLAIAVRTGQPRAAEILRRRGAALDGVAAWDERLGACVRGDRPAGGAPARLQRSDHQHVCWAIRTGHHDAVPALLELGLDPTIPDDDGETALHLAVAARSPAVLDALLAVHPRVDVRNFRDETPLTRAYREPDPELRAALAGRLLRAGARRQRTADRSELFEDAAEAVVDGDLDRLTALLDREPALATAHSFRSHRATLLHYAAANGVEAVRQRSPRNAAAVAELLIARGADPDALAATYGGGPAQTPLLLAVTSVHPERAGVMAELISALVRGGAKVDGIDDERSPIVSARRSAVPVLVALGARVDLVTAARLGLRDRVEAFVGPDGTLADGARLGADRLRGEREVLGAALLAACAEGHTDIADRLLCAGAPLDASDAEGMTALHHAAWRCHLDTMRLLLDRGAALEARNGYGGTVLGFVLWVVWNQWRDDLDHAAVVELLITAGADLDEISGVPTGREPVDAVFRRLRPGWSR